MNLQAADNFQPRSRALGELLNGIADSGAHHALRVDSLAVDSRELRAGGAFLACRGHRQHGIAHADAAIAAGARAILWEPFSGIEPPQEAPKVPYIAVRELGARAGLIADRFYDAPSARLAVTGVTGTNGKTTCAWLLAEALKRLGQSAAYMGTLGVAWGGEVRACALTTPDAVSVHRTLAELHAAGANAVAMEVSSHALDQGRCAGVRFRAAAFTNLTRDHLDYHGDMKSYGAAKARLFAWPGLGERVINVDDEFGAALATAPNVDAGSMVECLRRRRAPVARARFVRARQMSCDERGLELELETSWGAARLTSPLIGEFNADNLLVVLALLLCAHVPLAAACQSLGQCQAPPGRMQRSGGGTLPLVLVDYAHTPDALEQALRAARAHASGKLLCVFGCGGERDAGKRPQMGRVAAALADAVIVTDDNPRTEDPAAIVRAVLCGVGNARRVSVMHDRAAAIAAALAQCAVGDVILVAGKGHEDYQLVGAERRPFSDLAVVRELLARRGAH